MNTDLREYRSTKDGELASSPNNPSPPKASPPFVLQCGDIQMHSAPAEFIFEGEPERFKQIVTVNAEIFVLAHENPQLMRILSETTNTVDGRILQWLCMLLYPRKHVTRFTGADMIYDLAAFCQTKGERMFLLGSTPDAVDKAIHTLGERYAGLQIAGFSPPICPYPFPVAVNQDILDRVEHFRPDHLVVCFGPSKQERWIHDNSSNLADLGVRRAYGFGGSVDFVAGKQRRAPKLLQQMGIEWLFRLTCDPKARFRRTLTMIRMPFYVAKTKRAIL